MFLLLASDAVQLEGSQLLAADTVKVSDVKRLNYIQRRQIVQSIMYT